jgi:hypothetical protein
MRSNDEQTIGQQAGLSLRRIMDLRGRLSAVTSEFSIRYSSCASEAGALVQVMVRGLYSLDICFVP